MQSYFLYLLLCGQQLLVWWIFSPFLKYRRTPLIRIHWDGEPSGYAENPDNWIFLLKIGYIGSLKFGSYSVPGVLISP